MFKTIWRAKYLLHELLSTNHDCKIETVAEINYLTLLKYFTDIDFNSMCSMDKVANIGNLPVLIWLHNRGAKCTEKAMDWSATEGHLHIVKWLHENRSEGCTTDAMDFAAQDDHLPVIVWLHENRAEGCTPNAMNWAAEQGHLNVVKWLYHNRREGIPESAIFWADIMYHSDIVKWFNDIKNSKSEF